MDPVSIAAATQLAAGVGQSVVGAFQKGKAKRMARANKRPVYQIQKPVLDNQELIESRAGQGISDAGLTVMRGANERGLTTALDTILAGGGSVNNIADIYASFGDGTNKMALIDEEMRTKNIQNLIAQNNQLAAEKDKEWQVNIFAPYADKAQAAAALSKQGTDNMWKGINTAISAGANFATSRQFANQANNVYNQNGIIPGTAATGNNMTIPQMGDNGAINPWNWYQPGQPTPVLPMTPQQRIAAQYPGLMGGNIPVITDGTMTSSFGG